MKLVYKFFNISELLISLRNTSYGKEYQLKLSQDQADFIKHKYSSDYEKLVKDLKIDRDELILNVFFLKYTYI